MTLFLKYWKQIAGITLILIIFSFGYYKGSESKQREFDTFKHVIAVEAAIAEQTYQDSLVKQEQITKEVTKGYEDAIKKLNTHFKSNPVRLRNRNPSGSEVSTIPDTPRSVDETAEVVVSDTNGSDEVTQALLDCTQDVIQLLYLQDWVNENK